MESLKIDQTKLRKFSSYAKINGLTRQRVYQLEKDGKIKVIKIDGVKFVQVL
jgi:hypothetical protein